MKNLEILFSNWFLISFLKNLYYRLIVYLITFLLLPFAYQSTTRQNETPNAINGIHLNFLLTVRFYLDEWPDPYDFCLGGPVNGLHSFCAPGTRFTMH